MTGVPPCSVLGPLLFNICINDIIYASELFNFILYANDTTLNFILDCHGTTTDEIESSIVNELQMISKSLDVNRLCINVAKSKFMLFTCLKNYHQKIKIYISIRYSSYHIQFAYFAPHQLFIAGVAN